LVRIGKKVKKFIKNYKILINTVMTKKEMKIGDEIFANRERETALNTHTLDFGVSPLVNGSNANRHGVVSHLSRLFRDNTILSVKTPDRSANEQPNGIGNIYKNN